MLQMPASPQQKSPSLSAVSSPPPKLTPQNKRRYEYSLIFSCNYCRWTACNTSESVYFHSAEILAFWGGSGIFESLLSVRNEVRAEEQIPYHSHRNMSGNDLQLSQWFYNQHSCKCPSISAQGLLEVLKVWSWLGEVCLRQWGKWGPCLKAL